MYNILTDGVFSMKKMFVVICLMIIICSGCTTVAKPIPPPEAHTEVKDMLIYPYHPDGVICYGLNPTRNIIVESGGECISILVLDYVELLKNFYTPK